MHLAEHHYPSLGTGVRQVGEFICGPVDAAVSVPGPRRIRTGLREVVELLRVDLSELLGV